MTRKHFREVDFSSVCTAWIHINTTFTEIRLESLQNRTVAFCAAGTNPRLEAGEPHHPFLQKFSALAVVLLLFLRLAASLQSSSFWRPTTGFFHHRRQRAVLKAYKPLWQKCAHSSSSAGSHRCVSEGCWSQRLSSSGRREYPVACWEIAFPLWVASKGTAASEGLWQHFSSLHFRGHWEKLPCKKVSSLFHRRDFPKIPETLLLWFDVI